MDVGKDVVLSIPGESNWEFLGFLPKLFTTKLTTPLCDIMLKTLFIILIQ